MTANSGILNVLTNHHFYTTILPTNLLATILLANILLQEVNKILTEVLREIIGILNHDGYPVKQKDGHVFVSNLVRDWWKARFEFQYIPAAKRKAGS